MTSSINHFRNTQDIFKRYGSNGTSVKHVKLAYEMVYGSYHLKLEILKRIHNTKLGVSC